MKAELSLHMADADDDNDVYVSVSPDIVCGKKTASHLGKRSLYGSRPLCRARVCQGVPFHGVKSVCFEIELSSISFRSQRYNML